MPVYIGPYSRDRVVLCSGDAGPPSQEKHPCKASDFFPRAKWVTPRMWLKGQIADLLSSPQVVEWLTLEPS